MRTQEIVQTSNADSGTPETTPERTRAKTTLQKGTIPVERVIGVLGCDLEPLTQIESNLPTPEVVLEALPGVGVKCRQPPGQRSTSDAKSHSSTADLETEWKALPSEVKAHVAIKCRSSGQDWNSVSWEQKFKLLDVDALSNEVKQKLCALELLDIMGRSRDLDLTPEDTSCNLPESRPYPVRHQVGNSSVREANSMSISEVEAGGGALTNSSAEPLQRKSVTERPPNRAVRRPVNVSLPYS